MTATTTPPLQAKALYGNVADTDEELSFAAGDVLSVHERDIAGLVGWWLCSHAGRVGIAPGNRLRLLSPSDVAAAAAVGRRVQTDVVRRNDDPSTTKPRPSTAPQRGHSASTAVAQTSRDCSNGAVSTHRLEPPRTFKPIT